MNSNTSPPRRSQSPSDVALMRPVRSRTPLSNVTRMQPTATVRQAAARAPATVSSSQPPRGGRLTAQFVRPDRQPHYQDTVNCRECFQEKMRPEMVNNDLNGICLACQARQGARQANAPQRAQIPTEHARAAAWTSNLDGVSAFTREYNAFFARVAAPTYEDQRFWHQRRNALDQRKNQLDNFKRSIGYRSPSPQRGSAGPAPGSTRPASSPG